MRSKIHQTILLPTLCCMAFYVGNGLVGETEAAFSSRVSPEIITMNAAIVFPTTIQELEDRAQEVSKGMEQNMKMIVAPAQNASMEELHKKLDEVTAVEEELIYQLSTLQHLYEEVSFYHMDIQKQEVSAAHTYDYVREGFQHIEETLKKVQASADFSHIEEIRSSILLQIEELEDQKEPSIEQLKTKTELENTESQNQDEASTEITNKQVTAHEEETVEHSE